MIRSDKIYKAYERWCEVYGASTHVAFWKFLKSKSHLYQLLHYPSAFLEDEGVRNLNLILGDNYRAIIKVYKAQNGKNNRPARLAGSKK